MGWFDDQIEERKKSEHELLNDSFESIARSIAGKSRNGFMARGADVNNAVSRLLGYYHIKEKEVPEKITDLQGRLDFLLSSTGILYREVKLSDGWHKDAMGVLITSMVDGSGVVTVLPGNYGKYEYIDPKTGEKKHVTGSTEKLLNREALCFYKPFPQTSLTVKDLFRYMWECLDVWDVVKFVAVALIIVLVGLLMPKLNQIIMGPVIESGSNQLLVAVVSFMLFVTISNLLFTAMKELLLNTIGVKVNTNVQAGAMMRVLSMPPTFFKNYSSGELNQYLGYMNSLCATLGNAVLSTGITGLFSIIYITQIFQFATALVLPSVLVTLLTLIFSVIGARFSMKQNKKIMAISAREHGIVYNIINGLQKIRLSGAENRAFVQWADLYAKESDLTYNIPLFYKLNPVIISAVGLIGTIVIYYVAVTSNVSVADYYAFNSAYGYFSGAFSAIASVIITVAAIQPGLDVLKPFLMAQPEISEGKETVANLSGNIEIAHVTFKYEENGPEILSDISLSIPSRQYIAIVGKSGCGKSTLVRLLLGFETPSKGAIYYDRRDVRQLDMHSVRQNIGTVMQDGKLCDGSIYDNIALAAPGITLADAWEAAEVAGIAEDIRRMPMGMSTMMQAGTGGISGGQRQRLIIARAVAHKPKILIFDEATSALDNITQKKVSEALDKMNCTRIVVAHRLSTIRHCDRIIVLAGGKIIEDGTYEELMELNGSFADLVARQQLKGTAAK